MLVKLYYPAADLGGFGGVRENPPGCLKKKNFALKIQKRDQNLDNLDTELTSLGIN